MLKWFQFLGFAKHDGFYYFSIGFHDESNKVKIHVILFKWINLMPNHSIIKDLINLLIL